MKRILWSLVLLIVALPAAAAESPVLPWIVNDYPRALAEARARRLPLFIEAWAPW
jgi:hypothetical protein